MYVLKQITNTIPRTDINDHQPDIITNFITSDTTNNENENNSTWLFSKLAASSNINTKMYVLKRLHNTVQHVELDDFNQDPGKFS